MAVRTFPVYTARLENHGGCGHQHSRVEQAINCGVNLFNRSHGAIPVLITRHHKDGSTRVMRTLERED